MDDIAKIASLLTEDPDIFSDYEKAFEDQTVLDQSIYGDIVRILKEVAENNGMVLDHTKLKVRFNPAGLTLRNIHLEVVDPAVKRELVDRVAQTTGDDNIRHNFSQNLRANLYTAINKEFADRVREELNLDVTHQTTDVEGLEDTSEVLPMATFVQPAATAERPEEEMDMGEPVGAEPEAELAPEAPPMEPPMPPMGGGGGLGGLGGPPPEPPSEEPVPEAPPGEEGAPPGPYGLEPPEEEEEELPPPPEEEAPRFEDVETIADMLTEDPDVFAEMALRDCPRCGKPNREKRSSCWKCDHPFRRQRKQTGRVGYHDPDEPGGGAGLVLGKSPKFIK